MGDEATAYWWGGVRDGRGDAPPPSVVERLGWYERQVRRQRIGHHTSEVAALLLAAAVPAVAAAGGSATAAGVLGALVVVATGVRQQFRWGENWVRYGRTRADIQGELVAWSTGTAPYDGPDAAALLATRTEELARQETVAWSEAAPTVSAAPASPAPPPPPTRNP